MRNLDKEFTHLAARLVLSSDNESPYADDPLLAADLIEDAVLAAKRSGMSFEQFTIAAHRAWRAA